MKTSQVYNAKKSAPPLLLNIYHIFALIWASQILELYFLARIYYFIEFLANRFKNRYFKVFTASSKILPLF